MYLSHISAQTELSKPACNDIYSTSIESLAITDVSKSSSVIVSFFIHLKMFLNIGCQMKMYLIGPINLIIKKLWSHETCLLKMDYADNVEVGNLRAENYGNKRPNGSSGFTMFAFMILFRKRLQCTCMPNTLQEKDPNEVIYCLTHYVFQLPASVKQLHIFADNYFS